MKITQLKDIIREIIKEELQLHEEEESQAAKDAKAQGLEHFGFGRYGKNGRITHRVDNGVLRPYRKREFDIFHRKVAKPKKTDDKPNE